MSNPTHTPTPGNQSEKGAEVKDAEVNESSDDFKSEHSKQSVLADLAAERTARQQLQTQVDQLAPLKEQFEKLQGVFAPKQDGKAETANAVEEVVNELNALKLDAEVERLARVHKIEDDDTVQLLRSMPDKAKREELAKRLAPKDDEQPAGPRRPKPDHSAGRSGGDGSKSSSVESGRSLYRDMHSPKTT